ncbi:MAG: T9SS type A sorting domain-containing protein [Bacteroidota bacterium]
MKRLLQMLLMVTILSSTAQSYEFSVIRDYNNTGSNYELTFLATPDFTNAGPNFADVQVTFAVTAGTSIQTNSFTALLGLGWQVNTGITGTFMQSFGIGDGSKDLWVFTLPVPASALTTSHTAGQGIPIFSFVVDNTPTSGQVELIENDDPLVTGLSGIGFVVDNGINVDLGDGDETQDYYGSNDPDNKLITLAYTYNNSWSPSNPIGVSTSTDNIVIAAGDASIFTNTNCNTIIVRPGAGLTINTGVTLTTASGMSLESTSTNYSSLILNGSITGTVTYHRHVNSAAVDGTTTGNNDLVSPPLSEQTFGSFRAANPNLLSGTISGSPAFLFGPFNNTSGTYEIYDTTDDSSQLTTGVGYRTGSTDNGTFAFTGTVQTGTVTTAVDATATSDWYLIGNPYPSYIKAQDFLNNNTTLLDENATGLYGYDGSALNGWVIYNLISIDNTTLIAPGQGFFVQAESTGNITFTPSMRATGTDDDFITGRSNQQEYLKLGIASMDNDYTTDFYFSANASLGLDPGYDAAIWGSVAPAFALYSHLVEENTDIPMAIQAMYANDFYDVTIPLGVNAYANAPLTFSIIDTTIPSSIDIYLEDTVANTMTLLTEETYQIIPDQDLSGIGRFFLRFNAVALSTIASELDKLKLYTNPQEHTIVVHGWLLEATAFRLYDLQGRMILETPLENRTMVQRIDVSAMNDGVYIVELKNTNSRQTQKVILN